MRISDGSSDVCSSDLRRTSTESRPERSCRTSSSRRMRPRGEDFAVGIRQQRKRQLLLVAELGHLLGLVGGDADDVDPGVVELAEAVPKGTRSEERRVWKEGVSKCRFRGVTAHY